MYVLPENFDVIVIGAGHAGIEASLAAARLGCRTMVMTQNLDTIGQMSCNPAIGGQAKGQMVREIDALGGFMALNTDTTAIQFRMLNAKKGPSVCSPRAQCDKKAYQFRAKACLESAEGISIIQGNACKILVKDDAVTGVQTNMGIQVMSKAVVITTGTFMRGLLHIGLTNQTGGRMGDSYSTLSDSLRELGFVVERFKTGTPCRINGRTIDFSKCARQDGDHPFQPFSFCPEEVELQVDDFFSLNKRVNGMFHVEQIPCWVTHTNTQTHDIIRNNLDKSPLYSGRIQGVGPRYCPSIEDKVVKFCDKQSHQLFLEPEGRHTEEFYVNGLSTSLPFEVQYAFVHTVAGLENAEIIRPGYAVEYDYCPPTQLQHTLETKAVRGLYFAGQINGTSGYEEAAGQGLIAGVNAALAVLKKPAFIPKRSESYLGVMIDDLVTRGVDEPYRMFTSRAEHRLHLRHDNADLRLTPIGKQIGLVSSLRAKKFEQKSKDIQSAKQFCLDYKWQGLPLERWLRNQDNSFTKLPLHIRSKYPDTIWEICVLEIRFANYITRQQNQIEKLEAEENMQIPASFDYQTVTGLRRETVEKLSRIRPETLGRASRISGITKADIALLSVLIRSKSKQI